MKKIEQNKVIDEIKNSILLSRGFNFYVKYNTGISNPYHNINHTFGMMQLVMEVFEKEPELTKNIDKERLLLYAMYHDFGHSGGKAKDDVNVETAIMFLEKFLHTYGDILSLGSKTILRDTRFPYEFESKTLEGRILRECDMLQWIFDDFTSQVLFGLKTEMNATDFDLLLDNEIKFVNDMKFTIPYLATLYNLYKGYLFDSIDTLKEISHK